MDERMAANLLKYLDNLLEIYMGYTPEYLYEQIRVALMAISKGCTNGDMSDIACQIYLMMK